MKIKDRAKSKLPPVEPGVYTAVCVGVVDLGEQYSEKFKKYRNEVQFIWELTGETVDVDGELKPRHISRTFGIAAGRKSILRAFLSSWNGVQYSDRQFGELELFDQAGRPCQLNIVLNDTGEYANVDSAMPIPKGLPAPTTDTKPILWDIDQWDDSIFELLPAWIQEKIKKSTQYQKNHLPAGIIDFPDSQAPEFHPVTDTEPEEFRVQAEPAAVQTSISSLTDSDFTGGCPF